MVGCDSFSESPWPEMYLEAVDAGVQTDNINHQTVSQSYQDDTLEEEKESLVRKLGHYF